MKRLIYHGSFVRRKYRAIRQALNALLEAAEASPYLEDKILRLETLLTRDEDRSYTNGWSLRYINQLEHHISLLEEATGITLDTNLSVSDVLRIKEAIEKLDLG